MKQVFSIPNIDKNVNLVEEVAGLRMHYVLPCPKTFPKLTFISKNKTWYKKTMFIPYGEHMSQRIHYAYMKLKLSTMVDLALYHQKLANDKVTLLLLQQQNYLTFK
jgi:hypothetical protein